MRTRDAGTPATQTLALPTALVMVAMLASGTLIVWLGARIAFLLDDWTLILQRRSLDPGAFLEPANEHLIAAPVALSKLLLAAFGMSGTMPYRIAAVALFLLAAWLLYAWTRRRVGEWPALLATVLVLFLGAAFEDLLWFVPSVSFGGSMACGLGMLLALDRRDRAGDLLACALLVGSMLFLSLWVAFAAGAAADIALRRRERGWRDRAYVVAVPVLLYALWWIGWGHATASALSLGNVAATPLFVLDSIAAAIASLLGLALLASADTSPAGLDWGRPLAVALGALAAWRIQRLLPAIPRSLWVVLAIGAAFWLLGGLNQQPGRAPWVSRYQYPGAVFVLLIAAELLRGVSFDRRALAAAFAVAAAALVANVQFLHDAHLSFKATSEIERAALGAVEIARDTIDPDLALTPDIAGTDYLQVVDAGPYLSARDAFGSPAYEPGEILAAAPAARGAADKVLGRALALELAPARTIAEPGGGGGCRTMGSHEAAAATLELGAGRLLLRSRSPRPVAVRLGRFSPSFPVELGNLASGAWSSIAIPPDRSARAWRLRLSGAGRVAVCWAAALDRIGREINR